MSADPQAADIASSSDVELGDDWRVGGGLNGGYLLTVLGSGIREHLTTHPDPVVVSAHFLSAAIAGPATVNVSTVRGGGRFSTVAADLHQGEQHRITATATYGDLSKPAQDVRTTAQEPQLPAPEACLGIEAAPPELRRIAPLFERFDLRLDPACAGFAIGQPTGRGEYRAWFRLADGSDPDTLTLLTAVDALPPVSLDLGLEGWAPTLHLTAHVRARPAPGWLRLRHFTTNVAGGLFEEDCEVWDSTGRLVAQSRQLALLPR